MFTSAENSANDRMKLNGLTFCERDTISTSLVSEALADLVARGVDPALILKSIKLVPDDLKIKGGRISALAYARMWQTASSVTDDEFFGMNPRKMKSGSFKFISRALLGRRTLRDSLHMILRFFSLIFDDMNACMSENNDLAVITFENNKTEFRAFTYFTYWLLVIGLASWLIGRRLPVFGVDMTCERPKDVDCADYQTLFTPEIRFSQEKTQLCFSARFLDLLVNRTKRDLHSFLKETPANILIRYRNANAISARIKQNMLKQMPDAALELNDIARQMRIAPTTLRRWLEREGTTFQQIKDAIRRDLATWRLRNTDDSVPAIGDFVGFADTSSFFRAFRKWTGLTPGEYRARAKAEVASPASEL